MKNVLLILLSAVILVFASCKSNNKEEVLQANTYTYLNVAENDTVQWIAVTKIYAQVG